MAKSERHIALAAKNRKKKPSKNLNKDQIIAF